MLKWIKTVLSKFYLFLLHFGGVRLLKPIPENELELNGINVVTVKGYTVGFYCQEIKYSLTHHRLRWEKEYVLYRMYSVAVGNIPDKLKEIISRDVYLPMIVPSFLPNDIRKRLILEAYIDILSIRLVDLEANDTK